MDSVLIATNLATVVAATYFWLRSRGYDHAALKHRLERHREHREKVRERYRAVLDAHFLHQPAADFQVNGILAAHQIEWKAKAEALAFALGEKVPKDELPAYTEGVCADA